MTHYEEQSTAKCPEYYEMEPGDGGSCDEQCKAGCQGTGLANPTLSEQCPGIGWADHDADPPKCRFCHGTKRIALPYNDAEHEAMELLPGGWSAKRYRREGDEGWGIENNHGRMASANPDLLEALMMALGKGE